MPLRRPASRYTRCRFSGWPGSCSSKLSPQTQRALEALGSHLAVARVRRKESLATRAKRVGVSIPTLMRMESGDPAVSIGIYATALWLIGRDGELARIASPEFDKGAFELDIQQTTGDVGLQYDQTWLNTGFALSEDMPLGA